MTLASLTAAIAVVKHQLLRILNVIFKLVLFYVRKNFWRAQIRNLQIFTSFENRLLDKACFLSNKTMYEPREELKNRIYYAAKDGMSLALFTLTSKGEKTEIDQIINEVST